MASVYVATTNLNNAGRGLLSLYLMHLMGPTVAGTLAAEIAPYLFVSLLVTAFSAECFIRGSRHRFTGYRDRVASLLIDSLYLVLSIGYTLVQHYLSSDTRTNFLVSCILIASAFGQISLNYLLERKAWRYLAVANTSELLLHALLLATWLRDSPADQFILLAASRWLFINILNALYILRRSGITVKCAIIHTTKYLARLNWIIPAVHVAHLGNIGLKTLWTTFDVYIINMYWTATEAGSYRFVKALGGLPALALAPMWTVQRKAILADWNNTSDNVFTRFKTIRRFSLYFTLPLPAVVFAIYTIYEQLGGTSAFAYQLTVGGSVVGFSMWWLSVSMFGWGRYLMVALARYKAGNIQNLLIICFALSLVPLREFIDPQAAFPAVVFLSNFVLVYYILRKNA